MTKKFGIKIGTNASDDVVENAEIMESVNTDWYFPDLQKEENWISFNNNLIHLRKEDRTFTTAMHESKADKYLVAYSQDKGYVDDDKLNNYPTKEVTLMIDITKLSANLKPKENQLLMKIVKGVKAVEQQWLCSDIIDNARTTIPDNVSDLKRYCLKNKYSILKNIPTL